MERDTLLQHHGEPRDEYHGSPAMPVFRSSLFTFTSATAFEAAYHGDSAAYLYSRVSNPTVRVLEEKVAHLEGADDAVAFASGMGAVTATLLSFLGSGDHLVLFAKAYAPALVFARAHLSRFGVDVTFLDEAGVGRLEEALRPETRLIYVESPASLTFDVIDLARVAAAGAARGIPTATDNSWATPLFHQPIAAGMGLSLHSGTKYIGGHSDLLLGLVAGRRDLISRVRSMAILLGASLSPEDAFLAMRGLRTLSLRMARHQESAFQLARRLLLHEKVSDVLHPMLPFFPSHGLWKRQFSGASGLFGFRLRGDVRKFADALKLFRLGVSWGGFESLALPVALTRSRDASAEARPDLAGDLVRLSIGLEDVEDLWRDLEAALAAA